MYNYLFALLQSITLKKALPFELFLLMGSQNQFRPFSFISIDYPQGVLGSIHFRQSAVFPGRKNRQNAVFRFSKKCHIFYLGIFPYISGSLRSIN